MGRGPSGTLLICVANTNIPCRVEQLDSQKAIQFTVLNVRKKGWVYAPWKKPSKAGKTARDENARDLFEDGEWSKNDVTMERVGKSVKVYSFTKDGNNRGEREEGRYSVVSAGQTFRVILKAFMYEEKKVEEHSVFPQDVEFIPAFSVIEVMVSPSHTKSSGEGYGLNVSRVRACPFTLHSMLTPLGLGLIPQGYDAGLEFAEDSLGKNPAFQKILETKNVGFFGKVLAGSYLVEYKEDTLRLVGPKEDPKDPNSRHLNVMDGGVFAVDIPKDLLCRFTNAVDEDEGNRLAYARTLVDLASQAGALGCYVVYNEYRLRQARSSHFHVFSGVA